MLYVETSVALYASNKFLYSLPFATVCFVSHSTLTCSWTTCYRKMHSYSDRYETIQERIMILSHCNFPLVVQYSIETREIVLVPMINNK